MNNRPPSAPPQLSGYEYEQLLGSGGFADVFLYRQARPQRRVAIKVLLSDILDDSVRRQFDAEANVMATMSTHPSIVTIHTADVSSDGRPYLVMEYCPRPNYGVRFRAERITVTEVLRVGVQIAGSVETAHRAGILHRDIKPANILVTEYNRPALTDFGISIAAGAGEDLEDSQGMSIPWSPPEFFADPPRADVHSDVFSLAATVYSLLASRTPFEHPGRRNTATDLIARVTSEPLAPLARPDVPEALGRALAIAMAKDPAGRYDSALAFGRALQQVELAMSLPVTQMDVLDERGAAAPAGSDEDEDLDSHTRIRRVATIDPGSADRPRRGAAPVDRDAGIAPALPIGGSSSPSAGPRDSTVLRPAQQAPLNQTTAAGAPAEFAPPGGTPAGGAPAGGALSGSVVEAAPADVGVDAEQPGHRTPAWPFVTAAAALVIVLGVGSTVAARTFLVPPQEEIPTAEITEVVDTADPPGAPSTLAADVIVAAEPSVPGKAQVSWDMPDGFGEDDFFQVRWTDLPDNYERYRTTVPVHGRTSTVMDIPPNQTDLCVQVQSVSPSGQASEWIETCLTQESA